MSNKHEYIDIFQECLKGFKMTGISYNVVMWMFEGSSPFVIDRSKIPAVNPDST